MKDSESKRLIIDKIGKVVRAELLHLCSDNFSSSLLQQDASDFRTFDFNIVIQEAKRCTPTLHQLLTQFLRKKSVKRDDSAILATLICIMAYHHRNRINLFQKIVSLLQHAGHCSKMVRLITCYDSHSVLCTIIIFIGI